MKIGDLVYDVVKQQDGSFEIETFRVISFDDDTLVICRADNNDDYTQLFFVPPGLVYRSRNEALEVKRNREQRN